MTDKKAVFVESYIIRIYRKGGKDSNILLGTVEEAEMEGGKGIPRFSSNGSFLKN